jgi:hypothetical protein
VTAEVDFKTIVVTDAEWELSTGVIGENRNIVENKIATLEIGDNFYYVLVGAETYSFQIRRRAIFTVTFDTNGGTVVPNQQVEEGQSAIFPGTNPQRDGYEFVSWNYYGAAINGNTTITAEWWAIQYQANFWVPQENGEWYSIHSPWHSADSPATFPTYDPTWFAHIFRGWFSEPEYVNQVTTIPAGARGDLNFYAKFDLEVYQINWVMNGGINNPANPTTLTFYDGEIVLLPATHADPDFVFDGWYSDAELRYGISRIFANRTESQTIYAKFVPTIEFTDNMGDAGRSATVIYVTWRRAAAEFVLELPEKYNGVPNLAFGGIYGDNVKETLTKFTFPNGIKIGVDNYGASTIFNGFTALSTVILPNDLVELGDGNSTQYNPFYADNSFAVGIFSNCTSLKTITLPSTLKKIGRYAFLNSGLESIVIPNSVTTIGDGAFAGTALTAIAITYGTTSIYSDAFNYCKKLVQISVDSDNMNYKSVGNCLLSKDGKNLIRGGNGAAVPAGVERIGYYAFCGCDKLTALNLPASVKIIDQYAFGGCVGLVDLDLANVTAIYGDAFYGCSGLTEITIPSGVYATGAFVNCVGSKRVREIYYVYAMGAFVNCVGLARVVSLGGRASFSNCPNLVEVEVHGAFDLSFVDVNENMSITWYCSVNGVIGGSGAGSGNTNLQKYLTRVIFDNVNIIGDSQFRGCTRLTSIEFVNVSGGFKIGNLAFSGSGLTSVVLPSTVTAIGSGAFRDCPNLTWIVLAGLIEGIPDNFGNTTEFSDTVFKDCPNLVSAFSRAAGTTPWVQKLPQGASVYYYSEAENLDGGHWHFNSNGQPTIWAEI